MKCSALLDFLNGRKISDDHPRVYAWIYSSHSSDIETDRLTEHIHIALDFVRQHIPLFYLAILAVITPTGSVPVRPIMLVHLFTIQPCI